MEQIKKLFDILKDLVHNAFYGEVVIKMEAGKIVVIKKTESIKL